MGQQFKVDLSNAVDPLVLAIDVGSTATRGCLYDATGTPVGTRHKVPHYFTNRADGTVVIDGNQVVDEIAEVLTSLAVSGLAGRIKAVALDTFASSLVAVDADGRALTPAITYADSRCGSYVDVLRERVDEHETHQRTGTRLHASYLPARLVWLKSEQPAVFERAATFLSLGEFVLQRLLGTTAAGVSTAAWTGLLDRHTGDWDEPMLAASGIDRGQLSPVVEATAPLYPQTATIASRWPALEGVPWFPPVSDGYAANLGSGATDDRLMVATMATSGALRVLVEGAPSPVPDGLWAYRVSADQSLLGGAVNDVGRMISWLRSTLALPSASAVTRQLLAVPTEPAPTVLPFLTGERAIGWRSDARATFGGVAAQTTAMQLYRGGLEGVVISYARVFEQLSTVAGAVQEVRVNGSQTLDNPGLLQMMADVLGRPVTPVGIKRSTLRGTALVALQVVAPDVERAGVVFDEAYEPREVLRPYYEAARARWDRLYDEVVVGGAAGA